MSNRLLYSSAERRALAKFTDFYEAINRSDVANEAHSNLEIASQYPTHYLNIVAVKRSKANQKRPLTPLPLPLQMLLDNQEEDGRWMPNKVVIDALGGESSYPAAPESFSNWRWCTAIVLVFFKRHPSYHHRLEESYNLASKWTTDDSLMNLAREALPPGDALKKCSYFDSLDTEMIKAGRWKENSDSLYETLGYLGFMPTNEHVDVKPKSPYHEVSDSTEDEEEKIDQKLDEMWDEATYSEMKESTLEQNKNIISDYDKVIYSLNEQVEESIRIINQFKEKNNDESIGNNLDYKEDIMHIIMGAKEHSNDGQEVTQNEASKIFGLLKSITPKEEFSFRLNALEKEYNIFTSKKSEFTPGIIVESCWRKQAKGEPPCRGKKWFRAKVSRINFNNSIDMTYLDGECEKVIGVSPTEVRIPVDIKIKLRQERLRQLEKRWSQPIGWKKEWKVLKEMENDEKNKKPSWDSRSPMTANLLRRIETTPIKSNSAKSNTFPPKINKDKKENENKFLLEMKDYNNSNNNDNNISKINIEKDIVSKIINHENLVKNIHENCHLAVARYRTAVTQKTAIHAWDNLINLLIDFRMISLQIIETVQEWRKITGNPDAPFIWNKINYMLNIPSCCDFLSHCYPLREFFGEELKLIRNPFFIGVAMDDRATTPRKGTNTVLIDGHEVEQHSATLSEQRAIELDIYNTKFNLILNAPSYWPRFNPNDSDLFARIRRAEKVLIREEKLSGRKSVH